MPSSDVSFTIDEIFPLIASWQGHVSYTLFSIYAVNPELFLYYIGTDPGDFLFSNMLYGNAVYMYTRPTMKRLKKSFRLIFSVYGSYVFNFSSLLVFFAIADNYYERPWLVSGMGYLAGKIMYSLFYSYLYFVDKCADANSRSEMNYDIMFN